MRTASTAAGDSAGAGAKTPLTSETEPCNCRNDRVRRAERERCSALRDVVTQTCPEIPGAHRGWVVSMHCCSPDVASRDVASSREQWNDRGTRSTHTTLHTCSILYVDGGCHAGRKNDARRHLIDMDADRDALSKAHPREDRVR